MMVGRDVVMRDFYFTSLNTPEHPLSVNPAHIRRSLLVASDSRLWLSSRRADSSLEFHHSTTDLASSYQPSPCSRRWVSRMAMYSVILTAQPSHWFRYSCSTALHYLPCYHLSHSYWTRRVDYDSAYAYPKHCQHAVAALFCSRPVTVHHQAYLCGMGLRVVSLAEKGRWHVSRGWQS